MSAFLLKITSKVLGGRCLSDWGLRSPPPSVTHCINTCTYPWTYSPKDGGGGGGRWTNEKVRGALVHKRCRSKIPSWLTVSPVYELYKTPVKTTFRFGVFVDIWSMQRPLSVVHSITMEKFAHEARCGGGGCPTPFTISTITRKAAVYAPDKRADTLPLFHLYPYVLCGSLRLSTPSQPLLFYTTLQKPNSWTHNFAEFSGHNLESSQTWGFRIQCLHYKQFQTIPFLLWGKGGGYNRDDCE